MNLKDKVLEFVSIAKECPQNLQEKCFELLLNNFLEKQKAPPKELEHLHEDKKNGAEGKDIEARKPSDSDLKVNDNKQEDFEEKDLHVKTKRFLNSYSLSVAHINQIFYKQGEEVLPLFDDLKTTKASESQIRIALLQSLQNAIHTGNFEFDGEKVRKECCDRKCYDAANFAAIFKKNATLFENFNKYDKGAPPIHLSVEGKKTLANVINALQQ